MEADLGAKPLSIGPLTLTDKEYTLEELRGGMKGLVVIFNNPTDSFQSYAECKAAEEGICHQKNQLCARLRGHQ